MLVRLKRLYRCRYYICFGVVYTRGEILSFRLRILDVMQYTNTSNGMLLFKRNRSKQKQREIKSLDRRGAKRFGFLKTSGYIGIYWCLMSWQFGYSGIYWGWLLWLPGNVSNNDIFMELYQRLTLTSSCHSDGVTIKSRRMLFNY